MNVNQLLSIPGVTVVFDGTKKKNGIDTGEKCITVGVGRKKAPSELVASEIIPKTVGGKLTDVIEFSQFKALNTNVDRVRPLVGGLSIGVNGIDYTGTLGAIVRDSTNNHLVALTNNHVVGLQYDVNYEKPNDGLINAVGGKIMQPAIGDGGVADADVFGSVVRSTTMRLGLSENVPPNDIDAALVSIDGLNSAWFSVNQIHTGPFPFSSAGVGALVKKSGRTSGVTSGIITSTTLSAVVNFGGKSAKFFNQIYVETENFIDDGDSGSVLLSIVDGVISIVGLCFAGSAQGYGLINPIYNVADEMQIKQWDGDIVVPRSNEPVIVVNSTNFDRFKNVSDKITHEVDNG